MNTLAEKINNAQDCLYNTNQYELGCKYAQEAYMMNPDNPDAKYLYALALYLNDRCEEALKYFYELEKNNFDPYYFIYIAHCLCQTRTNLFLALKYINKLKRFNSHCDREAKIKILMIKAEIQYHMGDLDSALNNFKKAYAMGDEDKSLCYISQIYFDKNQPMLAMKYLRKVLRFSEKDKEEFWKNMEKLTYKELKVTSIILLNRFEIEKNKKEVDSEIYESIQAKLYPE